MSELSEVPLDARVTAVIVTWNSEQWITAAIESLPAGVDVMVWDNDSDDRTVEIVSRLRRPGLRLVAAIENHGFGPAINRMAAWADRPYLLILNPDCRLGAAELTALVARLDEYPQDAAVVPLLVGENGEPQIEFQLRRLPTPGSVIAELLLFDRLRPRNRWTSRYRYGSMPLENPVRIEQPAAAAMLIRRETFLRLGGFDETFRPAWYEDVDFCRRLADAGGRITLLPAVRAVHAGGSSLSRLHYGEFLKITHRNLARYSDKWFGRTAEVVRLAALVGVSLRIVLVTLGVRGVPMTRRNALVALRQVLVGWWNRWESSTSSS